MTTATESVLPALAPEPATGAGPNCALSPGSAPVVAWEVEIDCASCIVFAPTKAKAKWLAVKAYWAAYERTRYWPHTNIARRAIYDRFPHLGETKAFSPEYVRSLC